MIRQLAESLAESGLPSKRYGDGIFMRYRIFLPCLLFLFMGTSVYAETFTEQLQDLVKTHKRILATKAVVDSLNEGLAVSEKGVLA